MLPGGSQAKKWLFSIAFPPPCLGFLIFTVIKPSSPQQVRWKIFPKTSPKRLLPRGIMPVLWQIGDIFSRNYLVRGSIKKMRLFKRRIISATSTKVETWSPNDTPMVYLRIKWNIVRKTGKVKQLRSKSIFTKVRGAREKYVQQGKKCARKVSSTR